VKKITKLLNMFDLPTFTTIFTTILPDEQLYRQEFGKLIKSLLNPFKDYHYKMHGCMKSKLLLCPRSIYNNFFGRLPILNGTYRGVLTEDVRLISREDFMFITQTSLTKRGYSITF